MKTPDFYNTIEKPGIAEFKDRGSKFIGHAFPLAGIPDFKMRMDQIKKEHPKATHHCFAYRLGTDNNNFRVSDDREPSGTAGKQILGQIDSKELTDILVIVVRYFGGSLLGVPGLINAYKMTASLCLQVTPVVKKSIEVIYKLQFDYTQVNTIISIVKQLGCSIIEQEMQLFSSFIIGVPVNREQEFLYRVNELRNIEVGKHAG